MPISLFAPRRAAASLVPSSPEERKTTLDRGREAAALTLFAAAVYATLALASFRGDAAGGTEVQGGDWVGPVGAYLAHGAVGLLGLVALGMPIELALFAAPLLRRRASIANVARLAGDVLGACVVSALLHISAPQATVFGAMPIGGTFGELFGEVLRSLFSTIGSYIIGLTVIGLILIGRASFSFIDWVERAGRGTGAAADRAKRGAKAVADAWAQARELERERAEKHRISTEPRIDAGRNDEAIIAALSDEEGETPDPMPLQIAETPDAAPAAPVKTRKGTKGAESPSGTETANGTATTTTTTTGTATATAKESADAVGVEAAPKRRAPKNDGPTIVDTSGEMASRKATKAAPPPAAALFRLPSTQLLEPPPSTVLEIDRELLRRNAKLLEKTLNDYGVQGIVEEIHPGPTVTTYEVSPQAGTKVSKVASLADDLALRSCSGATTWGHRSLPISRRCPTSSWRARPERVRAWGSTSC